MKKLPMIAPLLALFGRSLREDTRSRLTYIARAGLVLIILLFLLSIRGVFGWVNAPGLRFFSAVVYVNFFFIVLAGLSHFAAAITEEKEDMTLGLLRMTNLNALSILLGKSTSRVVHALLLLAAQIPFTLLAISLGGVSLRQIVAAYCTLGAFTVFLANLALLASVVCKRTTGASVLTGTTLVLGFAGVPVLSWLVSLPNRLGLVETPSVLVDWLNRLAAMVSVASPFERFSRILTTGFAESPIGGQVWSNLGLGLVCFLLAWALFEVFCNEQQEATQPRSLQALPTSPFRWFGAGRVWPLALAWKDFYFLTGGLGWMAIKLVLYGLPPLLFWAFSERFGETTNFKNLGYFTFWITALIGLVELSFLAASFLRVERRWKTLSSLAMLPMGLGRGVYHKLLGCLPSLFPVAFYLAVSVFLFRGDLANFSLQGWTFDESVIFCFAASQYVLFLHVVTALSLHLRRGGLPAALAIHFVGNMLISILMVLFRNNGGGRNPFIFLILFCGIATVALHFHLGRRLETLAEED